MVRSQARTRTVRTAIGVRGRRPMYGPGNRAGLAAYRKAVPKTRTTVVTRRRKPKMSLAPRPVSYTGGPESRSSWILNRLPTKQVATMKRVGARNVYVENSGWQQTALAGEQANASFVYNSLYDLKAMRDKIFTSGSQGSKSGRYVLSSSHNELVITNNSTATAIVDIYDIVRIRDALMDMSGNQPSANPNQAWTYGEDNQGVGNSPNVICSLPTDSQYFKDYFKVVQRRHLGLQQGAIHRHTTTNKVNRVVDNLLLSTAEGDLKGFSIYTLVVWSGQPAAPTEGTPGLVSTAPITLNFVASSRYSYTYTQDNSYNIYQNNNLSNITVKGVNIGDGTIGDYLIV